MAAPCLRQGRQLLELLKLHSSLNTVSGAAKAFIVCAAINRAIARPIRPIRFIPVQNTVIFLPGNWHTSKGVSARCKQLNAQKELQTALLSESEKQRPMKEPLAAP